MNPDVHTLTGAYAMNALDDVERRAFERHMAVCPDCEQETRELERTAAQLGLAAAVQPPSGLRAKVFAEIAQIRQQSPLLGTLPLQVQPVVRQAPRSRWLTPLVALGAAASVLAAVVFGVSAITASQQRDQVQAQLDHDRALIDQVAAIVNAPDAEISVRAATVGGHGKVVSSKQLGKAVLLASDQVPAPASGKTLQAWAVTGTKVVSLGFMAQTHSGKHEPMVFPFAGSVQVGITVEPTGGSQQPTTPTVMLIPVGTA